MQTRSSLQRRSNSESSDRVVVHIKPRSWGDETHEQPQTVQPKNTGFDFKNADWFSHDPGPRSPVRVSNTIQAKLKVGAPNDQYEQEADSPGETLRERAAKQVVSTPDSATQQPIQQDLQTEPVGHNFSHVDWFSHDPGPRSPVRVFNSIQAKLTVGAPNDQYEQEADRVADQVMTTPDSAVQQTIQREAAPEVGEEDELKMKPLENAQIQREAAILKGEEAALDVQTKPMLQRETDGSLQADSDLEGQLNRSKSGGTPLPDEVRSFMEPRFGADFSQVRVHTGNESVQMNQGLNAQAFTHKQDVYFGAGKAPAKDVLTAHELTHVVQQTGGIQTKENVEGLIQRSDPEEEQDYTPSYDNVDYANMSTPEGAEVKVNSSNQVSNNIQNVHDFGETTIYSNETEEQNIDPLAYSTGIGEVHKEWQQKEKIDFLSANAKLGRFGEPNKDMRIGSQVDAQWFNGTSGNNGFFGGSLGFDGGVLGASADNSVGEDGFALGGQAYIGQAAARIGDVSSSEVNDEQLRFGYGVGEGYAARGHWGDQDKDGRKEIGFGADIGPASFDIKTEDPALTLLKAASPGIGWAVDALTDDKKFNLTDKALDLLGIKDNEAQ